MTVTACHIQENRSIERVEEYMQDRDINDVKTDTIMHWSCATREILARLVDGLDLKTGEALVEGGTRTLTVA